jgi:hypothetical protein
MTHSREPELSTFFTDSVVHEQMTAIDPDLDPVTEKRHHAVPGR